VILDTRRLFLRLLRTFEIATVCDVGSMDGAEALRFRRELPGAEILAFEPNPHNFALMARDDELRRRSIRILPFAVSDGDAEAPFFVVNADYTVNGNPFRRGMSSLHRRSDGSLLAEVVQVRTVRLDGLLTAECLSNRPIALWIDAEGMAFEAISGASAVLESVRMIHVEVETVPCIGANQRLFADVDRMLASAGFVPFATDQPRLALQFNALFIRANLFPTKAAEIRWHAGAARLRRNVKRAVHHMLPRRLRLALARALVEAPMQ
jgi:FkbM family methyltransferase